jgi:POT family proton-dependent oligopeptide transporter
MSEATSNGKHPSGLYVLFFTEMWERFSYYGMRALFVLFMTKALLFDKALGSQIYGSYTGLVYLTPLLGGYMADRYWGNRKSIIIGGILMAIGQLFMFFAGTFYQEVNVATPLMFTGLGFLIFGNGFFKPNISTMVGQLYPAGDKRVDSAFTISHTRKSAKKMRVFLNIIFIKFYICIFNQIVTEKFKKFNKFLKSVFL